MSVPISKKVAAVVANALRTSRPWKDDAEYMHAQRTRDAGYFMFLTWDLTVNEIGDKLRVASGYTFDRNAFMRACGVYSFACVACFESIKTSAPTVEPCPHRAA